MSIRILGIEIVTKTDILAFTAFLLSLSGIAYQLILFFRGPEVTLAKPRQVTIYMHPAHDSNKRYFTIISTLAYVNSGQSGNNAVVMQESVSFSLGGKQFEYTWHQFVTLSFVNPLETKKEDSRKIEFINPQTAAPFVVPGGGAASHETWFAARLDDDFIDHKSVARALETAATGNNIAWKFRFKSETLNDGNKMEDCEVTITPRLALQIKKQIPGWTLLTCK